MKKLTMRQVINLMQEIELIVLDTSHCMGYEELDDIFKRWQHNIEIIELKNPGLFNDIVADQQIYYSKWI